jgi:hypothetical protein
MSELVTRLNGEELLALVSICGSFLTVITAIIAYNWRVAKVAEMENQLKREMVSQGRCGAEIAQVVQARPQAQRRFGSCRHHQEV